MQDFVQLTTVHDVPDPGKAYFEVADRVVVLFHVGGEFFCLDDVCTHDGGPLGEGKLTDHTIACPRHGAQFDIRTGQALSMPATQGTGSYEVRVENEWVYVRATPNASPGTAVASESTTSTVQESSAGTGECCGNPASHGVAGTEDRSPWDVAPLPPTLPPDAAHVPLTEERVFEELKKVIDPELFVNIVDLGLVYVIELQPGSAEDQKKVLIEMTMTSPACPAGPQLIQNSKSTVGLLPGVESVEVKIVMDPPWTPDKMTDEARDHLGIF